MLKEYDYIIIGAGLAGGILARKLAENNKKKVLIIERRNHIAGNTYDYVSKSGIRVQKYGPHVMHTNSDEVYEFVTKYCNFCKFYEDGWVFENEKTQYSSNIPAALDELLETTTQDGEKYKIIIEKLFN